MIDEEMLKPFLELKKAILGELKVALIGIITSYDESTNMAQVQPIIKENFSNGTIAKLPLLPKVACIGDIPEVGDLALVVFTDRNTTKTILSYAYNEGTPFDNLLTETPKETRHTLNNGIAICGFVKKDEKFTKNETKFLKKNYNIIKELILKNGGVEVEN